MYCIGTQYRKFYSETGLALSFYSKSKGCADPKEKYLCQTGILNLVWQSWSKFWRTYWLAFRYGGRDLSKKIIHHPTVPSSTTELLNVSNFLLAGGLRTRPLGGYYHEPTWGDIDFILKCAIAANTLAPTICIGDPVLNAFSAIANVPKHFQLTRNVAVHLCEASISDLKLNVVPSYRIRTIAYPTDILSAREIGSGKEAFILWVDDLRTVIELTM